MTITEDMITPHHLNAAERWIAANGIPDAEGAGMSRKTQLVQQIMAEALNAPEHYIEVQYRPKENMLMTWATCAHSGKLVLFSGDELSGPDIIDHLTTLLDEIRSL